MTIRSPAVGELVASTTDRDRKLVNDASGWLTFRRDARVYRDGGLVIKKF